MRILAGTVVAQVDPVVLFPLFGSIDGVKTDLFPVQGEILFCFIGREPVESDVRAVVEVLPG